MTPGRSIFLAAGEVSGDVHGAALAKELRRQEPQSKLMGWGSLRMREAGVEILADLVPHAAVGLTENIPALRPANAALASARDFLRRQRPSALVLIDYQGLNLRLAVLARSLGIPTLYYIAPQEWIWGLAGGAKRVARQVDTILAIFEQEADCYRKAGATVEFVGHPILDQLPEPARVESCRQRHHLASDRPVLALFPGSRYNEIRSLLPPMLEAARRVWSVFPDLQVVLPIASLHFRSLVGKVLSSFDDPAGFGPTVIEDASGLEVLALSTAALAASGTVTLEAAALGTPVVATYRVSALTAFLARKLFKIKYVTLPNIILGQEVVRELLQDQACAEKMALALLPLLQEGPQRDAHLADLSLVRQRLGEPGATARAAQAILATVSAR